MKKNVTVLGCGMVGATLARDLASSNDLLVTSVDLNESSLGRLSGTAGIRTRQADLADPLVVQAVIADADVVVSGLPSAVGFQTLRAVIEAGKPYCDISFMPEDALALDALAKQHGSTAVVDCGVAPGLSNMIVGYVANQLDQAQRVAMYVGGLPRVRHWPFQYKAPFAPYDVLEEYTRPARIIENGRIVVKPALSEPEHVEFVQVGTLEAINTDGLRSLLSTMDIPDMSEKTLRYPGHTELMRVFREAGFFGKEEIEVRGVRVRPIDVASALLFPKWTYAEGEEEFTVLRVIIDGAQGGMEVRHTYDLYDEYDHATETSSMARTTAFPAAIVARMLAAGELTEPGVFPPELLARRPGFFESVLAALDARGVVVTSSVKPMK
ncbi:MAG: saccharopine dehydrogenase NADP-binding domain-containing protein [Planctomycetes bacterium]|nr:saccharopine dehydrogenase NADP-binding domain-containing protein [Planctomycetota bacterium]